jgi:hypothetical protein
VGTRRDRTGMGRKEKREGAGGDARTVRRERGEIWSEDGREMDEREIEEERKNRERKEWGRVIKILLFEMDIFYVCMKL